MPSSVVVNFHIFVFSLKPLNGIQRNLRGSKISMPSTKFVFLGRLEKQNGCPGLWLAETFFNFSSESAEKQDDHPNLWLAEIFSTSPLKPLKRIQQNLTGSKILTPSTKFVFFGSIGKTRWPPWPLIGLDIFDFSSETAEWNSTKLDRKQDLNALCQVCFFWGGGQSKKQNGRPTSDWLRHFRLLWRNRWIEFDKTRPEGRTQCLYYVCVFRADRKSKIAALASDWLRHFPLLWNSWTEFDETWWGATPSTKFVFVRLIGKTKWLPWPMICWDIFNFSEETAEQNSTKVDRKQDVNILYQACVFWADQKNKIAALASDWLRHFPLVLWNSWIEFNETWQKASSQRPLPSLFFFRAGPKNNMATLASDWLRHILTFPLKLLNGIQGNLTGSKILTSSTKFVFFGLKSE